MKILPFLLFVIAMTGTPGPGNLAMFGIGQATGFSGAIPFLCGTTAGFLLLNTAVGLGLGALFTESPVVYGTLKAVGTAYILYLAWKILRSRVAEPGAAHRFTFLEGLLIHPVSPKSWAMSVVGFSQFAQPDAALLPRMLVFVSLFFVGQVCFHSLWCAAGAFLMRLLTSPGIRLGVNALAVALMVGATFYALLT